jgi:tRNA(Ile)-lysidine synthase
LEAAARRARYGAAAQAMTPGTIALAAHHADDQAETVLLRLLRGAGPGALAGMRALRRLPPGWLARPWLDLPRAAIRGYAQARGVKWIEDPSNGALQHDRNYLRARIFPLLAERWLDAAQRMCTSARLLGAAALQLERSAKAALAACSADAGTLSASALATLDDFLLGEVLRSWLAQRALPHPPARVLARVRDELIEARPDGTPRLAWRGAELRRYRDALHALPPRPRLDSGWERAWDGRGSLELPPGMGLLALAPPQPITLRVSLRQGGERIALAPDRPTQSVKHLLQELGVAPWERARLPLLWHRDALWAVGDRIVAHDFNAWLHAHGARYLWQRCALTADPR